MPMPITAHIFNQIQNYLIPINLGSQKAVQAVQLLMMLKA